MSREVGRPRYRQIADDLKAAITSGEYSPGDRLPGENALMATYGVARMTARHALAALQAEGLTVTRRGAGVFVRESRPLIREAGPRLRQAPWSEGRSLWDLGAGDRDMAFDRLSIERVQPPAHVAELLALDGQALTIRSSRRYLMDGKPVSVADAYLPAALVDGPDDAPPDRVYARLTESGHAPSRFRENVHARMPTEEERHLLGLPAATPVVTIVRTAARADGTTVEVSEMTLDATAYILRYDFEA